MTQGALGPINNFHTATCRVSRSSQSIGLKTAEPSSYGMLVLANLKDLVRVLRYCNISFLLLSIYTTDTLSHFYCPIFSFYFILFFCSALILYLALLEFDEESVANWVLKVYVSVKNKIFLSTKQRSEYLKLFQTKQKKLYKNNRHFQWRNALNASKTLAIKTNKQTKNRNHYSYF